MIGWNGITNGSKTIEGSLIFAKKSNMTEVGRFINVIKQRQKNLKLLNKMTFKNHIRYGYTQPKTKDVIINLETHGFRVRVASGKFEMTVGIIMELLLIPSVYASEAWIRIKTINEKELSLPLNNIHLVENTVPVEFCNLTPKEKREKRRALIRCNGLVNKYGQEIRKDALIVLYSTVKQEMVYGKVVDVFKTHFEYVSTEGKTKRCYKPNMVYVPQNQNEFEMEVALEMLKGSA